MQERLWKKYRPRSLKEIVGQPAVRQLRAVAADPYSTAFLLESSGGGSGKTSAAWAFAFDVGLTEDDTDLHFVNACDVSAEWVRDHFDRIFRYRPFKKWTVCIIDEIEVVNPTVGTLLKTKMERMPPHLIVIATSNGAGKLSKPLLQRFQFLAFSCGECFAEACEPRLAEIWEAENPGVPMPAGWQSWGWNGDEFSMRTALDRMQASMLACCAVA